jgi:hypothetical protein
MEDPMWEVMSIPTKTHIWTYKHYYHHILFKYMLPISLGPQTYNNKKYIPNH